MHLENSNWKEIRESSFPFPKCVEIGQSQDTFGSIFILLFLLQTHLC